jgi:hypothetical protein
MVKGHTYTFAYRDLRPLDVRGRAMLRRTLGAVLIILQEVYYNVSDSPVITTEKYR